MNLDKMVSLPEVNFGKELSLLRTILSLLGTILSLLGTILSLLGTILSLLGTILSLLGTILEIRDAGKWVMVFLYDSVKALEINTKPKGALFLLDK